MSKSTPSSTSSETEPAEETPNQNRTQAAAHRKGTRWKKVCRQGPRDKADHSAPARCGDSNKCKKRARAATSNFANKLESPVSARPGPSRTRVLLDAAHNRGVERKRELARNFGPMLGAPHTLWREVLAKPGHGTPDLPGIGGGPPAPGKSGAGVGVDPRPPANRGSTGMGADPPSPANRGWDPHPHPRRNRPGGWGWGWGSGVPCPASDIAGLRSLMSFGSTINLKVKHWGSLNSTP